MDIHNETLGAGGPSSATKKKRRKRKKSGPRKKLERRTTEEQTPRKSVAFSKRHHGPESVEQCPQWSAKKACVVNGFKNDACVDEGDVIGVGRFKLSDGQCYSQISLQKWIQEGKSTSPVTEMPFTESDIKVIKSPMKEQEKIVVQSLTTTVLKQFRRSLVSWKKNTMRMAEATDPSIAKQAAKMSVGAAAGAAVALMTGVGALAGAVGGAAMAFDWLRNQMISKGIDLVTWIVKSPKTAMMFLFIVKQFIKAACKEAAKMFAMATYDRKSKFQQYVGGAKDMLGTIAEGGHISMGTLMRCNEQANVEKHLEKRRRFRRYCRGECDSRRLVKSGASMIVSGCVNCAEEAARTGIELAAYQKDIKTGMQYVGDILHATFESKAVHARQRYCTLLVVRELALDERACMGQPVQVHAFFGHATS